MSQCCKLHYVLIVFNFQFLVLKKKYYEFQIQNISQFFGIYEISSTF